MPDLRKQLMRYQIISFPEHRIEFEYYSKKEPWDVSDDTPPDKAEFASRTELSRKYHSVLHAWLVNETDLAIQWSRRGLELAEIYLWGSWRELAPIEHLWGDVVFEALHLGAMIDEWAFVEKLATYPAEDMHILIETKSNRAWLLLLCGAIAKRPWVDIKHHFDLIQSQPQKREKLLARTLQSLVQGTDEELLKSTKEYFAYFKKSESKSEYITRMLPVDASIVFHVARHWQRPLPVPADFRDHIIELPIPASEG